MAPKNNKGKGKMVEDDGPRLYARSDDDSDTEIVSPNLPTLDYTNRW